ncbi:MAG TPA: hypothetical protein VF533_08375 [Solirubrobacteraceae bacterium]
MRRLLLVAAGTLALLPAAMAPSASAMFTRLEQVATASPADSAGKAVTVPCPAGKRVVGTGASVGPGDGNVRVDAIRPDATLASVTVHAREDETGTPAAWSVTAYAVCAPAPAGLVRAAATSASSSAAKSVAATCPAGKALLGSGAEAGSAHGQVLLDGIVPNLANRAVTVNAVEDETGDASPWTVTAYAICSDPVTGLQRTAATTAVSSTAPQTATAACPRGKSAISGGGTINGTDGQVVLRAASPTGDLRGAGFAASEDDTGSPAGWSVTAFAVCAAVAQLESRSLERSASTAQAAFGDCPPGQEATGFGGEVTGGFEQVRLALLVGQADRRTVFEALAEADETGPGGPWSVTAYAICVTAVAGSEVVRAAGPDGSSAARSAVAACPPGKRVLGAAGRVAGAANQLVLTGLRPDSALSSVTATAHEDETGTAEAWHVDVIAVCAPPPPGLQRVAATTYSGSEEFARASATCPTGEHLIGTGARIGGGAGQVGIDDLRPDAALTRTTVTATEDETGSNADWSATAYAICIAR